MYRILIVEDEMFVRIGLENVINWADYQLKLLPSASNGKEALELYEKYHPDLIVTDIKMPEMDGLELISAIRAQDRHVKFIVLTCIEEYQTVKQALNLSVSHYYNKSDLDVEELKRYIAEIVSEFSRSGVSAEQQKSEEEPDCAVQKQWEEFFFEGKPCDLEKLLTPYWKPNRFYYLIQMELNQPDKMAADKKHFSLVQNLFREILNKQNAGFCLAASQQRVILLYGLQTASQEQRIEQISAFLRHLELAMRNYFNIFIQTTSSSAFTDRKDFSVRWEEVVKRAKGACLDPLPEEQIPSQKIFAVVQYVREHLAENLTLSTAAEYANFSAGYLGALFKREMNVSFSEFVLNMRLKKVKFLLTGGGDDTLASIAEQTGLYDASYLVKVFKKTLGITPNEYRQQAQINGRNST